MIDDEPLTHDLSAWEVPEPPADLADAVLARMADTGVATVQPVEATAPPRRALLIAGGVAAALALVVCVYALVRGSEHAGARAGHLVADRARALSLGSVHAELDPGARVAWQRRDGALRVQQEAGAVAWRVDEGDRLVIDAGATVASVEASGASLRVEVKVNQTDARLIGASALTAAAVSLVSVVVYEGYVKVGGSHGQPVVIVQPGSTYNVTPPTPPAPPPVVGGGPVDLQSVGPTTGDVRIRPGDTAVFHIAEPPVLVDVDGGAGCTYELDGKVQPNAVLTLGEGQHRYGVTCNAHKVEGLLTVVRDDFSRPVARAPMPNRIAADGRTYHITFQSMPPDLDVGGGSGVLHLMKGGVDRTYNTSRIPGGDLETGTYTVWFDGGTSRSTVIVELDESVPFVQVSPVDWKKKRQLQVRVIPATILDTFPELPAATDLDDPAVTTLTYELTPPLSVIVLRAAHPWRGMHYYIVRKSDVIPEKDTKDAKDAKDESTPLKSDPDRDALRPTFDKAASKFIACRQVTVAAKSRNGKLVFKLKIKADGSVEKVAIEESFDAAIAACIAKVMEKLQFPASSGGLSVRYPLVFSPPTACEEAKEKGMQAINLGKHAEALVLFEKALTCGMDPYLVSLAFMEACASKNAPKARTWWRELDATRRAKFAQICIRNNVAGFDDPDPTLGTLELESNVTAQIYVDGKNTYLKTPVSGSILQLPPGKHKVTFYFGSQTVSDYVTLEAGKTVTLRKDLE